MSAYGCEKCFPKSIERAGSNIAKHNADAANGEREKAMCLRGMVPLRTRVRSVIR
jgi:hypothetical protein